MKSYTILLIHHKGKMKSKAHIQIHSWMKREDMKYASINSQLNDLKTIDNLYPLRNQTWRTIKDQHNFKNRVHIPEPTSNVNVENVKINPSPSARIHPNEILNRKNINKLNTFKERKQC
ncbi:hypothetical protein L6164_033364 [Bauhinia variegata]|uniref:Uncharacterized protein n=1 Tax=Bauhinia variegata TaxID=167791 RepID=A0ACB9KRG5_BAUVA|nr:hypothetical protein L6164_033364 [Bauhinia variegata]